MKKSKISKNMFMRVMSLLMIFAFTIGGSVTLMAADDEGTTDSSLYRFSSAISAYVDATSNPDDSACDFGALDGFPGTDSTSCTSRLEPNQDIEMTDIGGGLGFIDRDYEGRSYGIGGFFGNNTAQYTADRDGLNPIDDASAIQGGANQAIGDYVRYGLALQDLGIDDQALSWETNLYWLGRVVIGFFLALFFGLASVAGSLFDALIIILQKTNIFHVFYDALNGGDAVAGGAGAGAFGPAGDLPQGLQNIADGFSNVYAALYDMAVFVIIPLTIVFIVLGMVVLDHNSGHGARDQGGRFKKVLFGIAFVVIGVPLLGFTYTAVLDGIADGATASLGDDTLNQLVYQEFVDFDSWANEKHLALPEGVEIVYNYDKEKVESFTVDGELNDYQALATSINDMVNSSGGGGSSTESKLNEGMEYVGGWMWGSKTTPIDYSKTNGNGSCVINTFDEFNADALLKSAGQIDASKYSESDGCPSDVTNTDSQPILANPKSGQPELFSNDGGTGVVASVDTDAKTVTYTGDGTTGLSTLSMYNYLSSEFDNDAVTVWSQHKVNDSGHRSYTAIGRGFTQLTYLIAFAVSVICTAFFTLTVARSMLFNNIVRSVKLLMAIPFAMTTAFQAVMKVTAITLVMILELIVGYVVYNIGTEFIAAGPTLLSDPIGDAITESVGGVAAMVINGPVSLIIILISSAAIVALTFTFCKIYGTVVNLLEEFVDNIIKRMGGDAHTAGGGVDASAAQKDMVDRTADKMFGKADANGKRTLGGRDANGKANGKGFMGKAAMASDGLGSLGKSIGDKASHSKFGDKHRDKSILSPTNAPIEAANKASNDSNTMSEEGTDALNNAESIAGTYKDSDGNIQEGSALETNGYGELLTNEDGSAQLTSSGEGIYSENEFGGEPLTDVDGNVLEGPDGEPLYTDMADGSYAIDPETGAAMLDENGDPIKGFKDEDDPTGVATNADGSVISTMNEKGGVPLMDENGDFVKDQNGNAIYDIDENGGATTKGSAVDINGNTIYSDEDGRALDAEGTPIRSRGEFGGEPIKDPRTGAYQLDGNGNAMYSRMSENGAKPVPVADYIDPITGEINQKYKNADGTVKKPPYHMDSKGKPVLSKLDNGYVPKFNKNQEFVGYGKKSAAQKVTTPLRPVKAVKAVRESNVAGRTKVATSNYVNEKGTGVKRAASTARVKGIQGSSVAKEKLLYGERGRPEPKPEREKRETM